MGKTTQQLPNSQRGHWLVEREARCKRPRCGATRLFAEREFTDDEEGKRVGGGTARHDLEWPLE